MRTHVGIPDPDTESNDAVVLGFLVAQFIGEVCVYSARVYRGYFPPIVNILN